MVYSAYVLAPRGEAPKVQLMGTAYLIRWGNGQINYRVVVGHIRLFLG